MTHCATCDCADDERPPQPSTSSAWARRAALQAAEAAVRAARDRRTTVTRAGTADTDTGAGQPADKGQGT